VEISKAQLKEIVDRLQDMLDIANDYVHVSEIELGHFTKMRVKNLIHQLEQILDSEH